MKTSVSTDASIQLMLPELYPYLIDTIKGTLQEALIGLTVLFLVWL